MNLQYVTVTGADDNTDPRVMSLLSSKYPLVEWGILFSEARYGTPRYPSKEKVGEILRTCALHGMRFSLHLCGEITMRLMTGDSSLADVIIDAAAYSKAEFRVQINFNGSRNPYDVDKLCVWMANKTAQLWNERRVLIKFIFQLNKSNKQLCEELWKNAVYKPQFLYDASGGRGTVIMMFEPPVPGHLTGYAGGLSGSNVGSALKTLQTSLDDGDDTWIDAESGLRTDNVLDMHKVEDYLIVAHNKEKWRV